MSTLDALEDLRQQLRLYLSKPIEGGHFKERSMVERERKRLEDQRSLCKELLRIKEEMTETKFLDDTEEGRLAKEKFTAHFREVVRQANDPERQQKFAERIKTLETIELSGAMERLFDRANYLAIIPAQEILNRFRQSYAHANLFYQLVRIDSLLTYESLLLMYAMSKDPHIASIGEGVIEASAAFYGVQADLLAALVENAVFKEFIDEVESLSGRAKIALIVCECPELKSSMPLWRRKLFGANRYFDSFQPLNEINARDKDKGILTNYQRLCTRWKEAIVGFPDTAGEGESIVRMSSNKLYEQPYLGTVIPGPRRHDEPAKCTYSTVYRLDPDGRTFHEYSVVDTPKGRFSHSTGFWYDDEDEEANAPPVRKAMPSPPTKTNPPTFLPEWTSAAGYIKNEEEEPLPLSQPLMDDTD